MDSVTDRPDDDQKATAAARIIVLMHGVGASGATIARTLGMNPRTTQRMLQDAGLGRTTGADLEALIGFVHERRHAGLSLRAVVAELDGRGTRRSLGWVSSALREWTCPKCRSDAPSGADEHPTVPGDGVQSRPVDASEQAVSP